MRNDIIAPIDGIIKIINVKVNEKIIKGTVIIELDN
jgi:multidrug efflux pump subunit AcrA (membrane-fusion protein)